MEAGTVWRLRPRPPRAPRRSHEAAVVVEGNLLVRQHTRSRVQARRVRQEDEAERPPSGVGVERFHECPERSARFETQPFIQLFFLAYLNVFTVSV